MASMRNSEISQEIFVNLIVHYMMTQNGIRSGLRKFKKRGEMVVKKELKQIHDLQAFLPMDASQLTEEEKRRHKFIGVSY